MSDCVDIVVIVVNPIDIACPQLLLLYLLLLLLFVRWISRLPVGLMFLTLTVFSRGWGVAVSVTESVAALFSTEVGYVIVGVYVAVAIVLVYSRTCRSCAISQAYLNCISQPLNVMCGGFTYISHKCIYMNIFTKGCT